MSAPAAQPSAGAGPRPGDAIHGERGLRAEVEQVLGDGDRVIARLADGRRLLLPVRLLRRGSDGFHATLSPDDINAATADATADAQSAQTVGEERVIPIIEERVHVAKRAVEQGRVRVRKVVTSEEQEVAEDLLREEVEVERVECNAFVDDADNPPQARQEGDVWIVPLLEEVVVVETRLVVREELHIRRVQGRHVHRETVTVRREDAQVERLDPN